MREIKMITCVPLNVADRWGIPHNPPNLAEYVAGDCDRCGAGVLIGPLSKRLIDKGEAAPLCVRCLVALCGGVMPEIRALTEE